MYRININICTCHMGQVIWCKYCKRDKIRINICFTFLHVGIAIGGEKSVQIRHMRLVHMHFCAASIETNLSTDFDVFGIIVKSFSDTLT